MKQYEKANKITKSILIAVVISGIVVFFYMLFIGINAMKDNKNATEQAQALIEQIDAEHTAFLNKHCSVIEYDFSGKPYKYSCYGTIFTNK